jgi:Tfp pilus assembly protein FimV
MSAAAATAEQLNRQAQLEDAQAAIAQQDAAYEAFRARLSGGAKVASAKVAYAASGVATESGTPATTIGQLARGTDMDVALAYLKGKRISWTHQERAKLLRAGVEDVEAALPFNLASSVVGVASRVTALGKLADPGVMGNGIGADVGGFMTLESGG